MNNINQNQEDMQNILIVKSGCCSKLAKDAESAMKNMINRAVEESGTKAKVTELIASMSMLESLNKKNYDEVMDLMRNGKQILPVFAVNGEIISYGIPSFDTLLNALTKNQNILN
ncbi:MAG: hypothetical protein NT007_14400 [Candidatus Kapabacteria bacterium]|nr:hypothetical protein [Candidatus Kapabacteria bacterium]